MHNNLQQGSLWKRHHDPLSRMQKQFEARSQKTRIQIQVNAVRNLKSNYKRLLEQGRCWRAFRACPRGKDFLRALYLEDERDPLDPFLVWKICNPCEFEGVGRNEKKQNESADTMETKKIL